MWLVTINCSTDAWKQWSAAFLTLVDKYQGTCLSSKKTPQGDRTMEYKIEDVADAEVFTDECQSLEGFAAQFASL
ncbi:hypothetical protein [Synechocystis sp. PCC 7509]|uniref:hypothetical protein n=1 Tax=Synechocystis sp. PCC 7509 TaxID=927677 RepID=UPI0002AD1402|nr:hypothetical protein [Synechocystis sp. PCC 7509]